MNSFELLQTAFANLFRQILAFLPALFTAVLLGLAGWIIARVLAAVARRIGVRVGLDEAVDRTGISEGLARARIRARASDIISRLVFWLVFLSFFLVALETMGLSVAVAPLQGLIAYLPRVIAAALAVIIGSILAQVFGRTAQAGAASVGVEFDQGIGRIVQGLILIIAVVVAIDQLGLDVTLLTNLFTNLLTIIIAGLALAFGLGGREIARNVLNGYYARETFPLGETVIVEKEEGVLDAIGSVNAEIRIGQERLVVPNSWLVEGRVKIRTKK